MLVAIHAGKQADELARFGLWHLAGPHLLHGKWAERGGGIVGVVRFVERIGFGDFGEIEGRAMWERLADQHLNPLDSWAPNKVGWRFEAPVRFPALIPCRGRQGMWTLPEEVERRVAAAYLSSPRADGVIRFAEEAEMAMVRDQAKGGR